MTKENDYVAADLSQQLVGELKSFEEKLCEQSNKDLVVIAYEKDGKQGSELKEIKK